MRRSLHNRKQLVISPVGGIVIRRAMTLSGLFSLAALGAAMMTFLPADGLADAPCSGHKLLPKLRPEASYRNFGPQIYASPDNALRASVLPADVVRKGKLYRAISLSSTSFSISWSQSSARMALSWSL